MSNRAKTQAQWDKLMKELALGLGIVKDLRDKERKFDPARNRTQIHEEGDANLSTSGWILNGVDIGVNTDVGGKLYVRITDGTPNTVDLYKATGGGGGDKVATGTAADLGTATLSAANSSGITGSVVLGTIGANETNDRHHLVVIQDWPLRANNLFDGSEPEHNSLLLSFLGMCDLARLDIGSAISKAAAWLQFFLLTRWNNFQGSSSNPAPIQSVPSTDANGNVIVLHTGGLEDGRKNMVDELTAGAQSVQQASVSAGSVTADSQNQGFVSASAPTMEQWAQAGEISIICIDETFGSEKCQVTQRLTANPSVVLNALSTLQIGKTYADPILGIGSLLLSRSPSLTSGSTNDFAAGSNWSFSGESASNTAAGVLYLKVTGSVGAWVISLYKDTTYTDASKVGYTAAVAAGTSTPIIAYGSSGLTGTAKVGSAPTTTNTGTLDLRGLKAYNTNRVADKWTIAVTVASRGEFGDRLAELFNYAINTSNSPTISDEMVKAGTFPAFEVRDA